MSVTAKDFRRFVEGSEAREEGYPRTPVKLMEQSASQVPDTTDERLNKLIRILQSDIDKQEENLTKLSQAAMLATNPEQKLQMTYTYFITKGIAEALKGVQQLPARILEEETPQHVASA